MRCAGAGMPTSSSNAERALACGGAADVQDASAPVSTSCSPTVYSGFRLVSGSWKIIAMRRPRRRQLLGAQLVDALAVEQDLAAGDASGRLEQVGPMMAAPVSDLPAPDSPTTPSTSPRAISNETSSIATSVPRRVGNSTRRWRTGQQRHASAGVHLVDVRQGHRRSPG